MKLPPNVPNRASSCAHRFVYSWVVSRIDSALLAGIGILGVHQIAYTLTALAGTESSVAHGHLQSAWLLASLGLLGALARSIVRSVRRRTTGHVSELALFAWIAGGYFVLEQAERTWDGYGALTLFSEPVFWIGLALSPLIALALTWSVRSLERALNHIVESLTRRPERMGAVPCSWPATGLVVAFDTALVLAAPRRGPPQILFH